MIPEATPLTCRGGSDRPATAESCGSLRAANGMVLSFFVMDVPTATRAACAT